MRLILSVLTGVVVTMLLTPAVAAAQAPPMRAGMWELTVNVNMPNFPVAMPPITTNQCVTPDMLETPDGVLGQGPLAGPMNMGQDDTDCEIRDYELVGQTVTWAISCTQPQEFSAEGEMTFGDDRYTGTMSSQTPQGLMTMSLDAVRTGDCN